MPSTYSNLLYHIIFSTKNRIALITDALKEELYKYIGGILRAEGGLPIEIGGIEDHVHILAKIKPAIAVSEMLNKIKANSSNCANDHKNEVSQVRLAGGVCRVYGERVAGLGCR